MGLVSLVSDNGLRRREPLGQVDLQAVDTPEILYYLVKSDFEASVIGHVAPAQTNPLVSIIYTIS